jgi:hypothetical protein
VSKQFESLEQRLKCLRLTETTDRIKRQVLSAGREAWHETSGDVPWLIPTRRLGIAAAVATAIVWSANYAGDRTVTAWQTLAQFQLGEPASNSDERNDASKLLLTRHMPAGPRQINPAAIREYQEQVRRMLDEQG